MFLLSVISTGTSDESDDIRCFSQTVVAEEATVFGYSYHFPVGDGDVVSVY